MFEIAVNGDKDLLYQLLENGDDVNPTVRRRRERGEGEGERERERERGREGEREGKALFKFRRTLMF